MTMLRSSNPKRYVPGVHHFYGLMYPMLKDLKSEFLKTVETERSYEETVSLVGISTAGVKNETSGLPTDDVSQGFVQQSRVLTYGKAVYMSMEAIEDDLYSPELDKMLGNLFARSMNDYEQRISHNLLNLGFSAVLNTQQGLMMQDPDGVSLFNTAHIFKKGGTYSNTLVNATTVSESAIETLVTQIRNSVSADGNRIAIEPRKLIVSPADEFNAKRILHSEYQTGSANNDINAVNRLGLELVVSPYLTAGNWHITTDINDTEDGLTFWRRKDVRIGADTDELTLNALFTVHSRSAVSYNNPQACFGVQGP